MNNSNNRRPLASLSLDADNLWAYQMTHGDPGWDTYPTYLDALADAVLPVLESLDTTITFFVVGQDASLDVNHKALTRLAEAGHEIGNHSFSHQPWMHRTGMAAIHDELDRAETALAAITGERPVGFRGPGYSLSADVLRALIDRGYTYDCSTLPTVVGPLARWFYFRSAKLSPEQRQQRSTLFGSARDGLRPLRPYEWELGAARMLERPVTTMPMIRVPSHLSYVLYLAGLSESLAVNYFAAALRVCRLRGVEPSILMHPLDVLGADDVASLEFFPGMAMTGAAKREIVARCLEVFTRQFRVVPMHEHVAAVRARGALRRRNAFTSSPAAERAA